MSNENQTDRGFLKAAASAIVSRLNLSSYLGSQFGGKRDLYEVFGYPKSITVQQLLAKYSRQDIASRIVSMPAGATWNNHPTLVADNAITGPWETMIKKHKLWNVLLRADKLSAMGRYSAVMLGVNDGNKPEIPLTPNAQGRELLFLKPLSEISAEIESFITDPTNPRFGMPNMYKVKANEQISQSLTGGANPSSFKEMRVHHTRIVHIVQDPLEDLVYGSPILEKVYNLLEDLLKVAGGSAETYWLNSRKGLQANVDKDMDLDQDDAQQLADMIEEYQHELRRVIRTRGVEIKDLGASMSDPRGTFELVTALLAGATGIPQRILVGSEAGQLASEQDRANWADRIDERRTEFAEPIVLDSIMDRLQEFNIIPEGDYTWEWPDAFRMSPLERAQTMAQKARAVSNLVKQYDGKHIPMTSIEESREVIGLEEPFDPKSVLQELETGSDDEEEEMDEDEEERRIREEADSQDEGAQGAQG